MAIETKYNIGDEVWWVGYDGDWHQTAICGVLFIDNRVLYMMKESTIGKQLTHLMSKKKIFSPPKKNCSNRCDMEWNDKIEMAKLLNNGNYAEAVEFIKDKEIDAQAMDVFITGFDLSQWKLLEPIRSLILSYDSGMLDFRSALRMEFAKEQLKSL